MFGGMDLDANDMRCVSGAGSACSRSSDGIVGVSPISPWRCGEPVPECANCLTSR